MGEMYKKLLSNIDFSSIQKDNGIYEYDVCKDLSIGISFENNEENNEVYIYNLFLADTYVNISNRGTVSNKFPNELIEELSKETPKEYYN